MDSVQLEDHLQKGSGKQECSTQKSVVRCSSANASYTPTGRLHRHQHHEILIIHRGQGTHQVDDQVYTVSDNQIYFLRPGQIHQFNPEPGTEFYFVAIDDEEVALQGSYRLSDFEFFQSFQTGGMIQIERIEPILELVKILQKETHTRTIPQNQRLLICGYLSVLLVRLQREFLRLTDQSQETRQPELVEHFNLLIDDPAFFSRFVKDYADKLHVSANYLNEMVKKATGEPASYWIHRSLIAESKRRLRLTTDAASEIASSLKFQEATHFTRFFKQHTGQTPSQFRAS